MIFVSSRAQAPDPFYSMPTTIALAANAIPDRGGQGVNLAQMVDALRPEFKVTVYCQTSCQGVASTSIPDSRVAAAIDQVPLLRRLGAFRMHLSNTSFDRRVAAKLAPVNIFQGVTGQCLHSLRRARQLGAFTVLDSITTHVEDYLLQQQECRLFGIRPATNEASRRMVLAEYQAADVIRVMSKHSLQTFLEHGIPAERVMAVQPALSVHPFPVADFRGPFRVSFVGLLSPAKGFHYLIEAFKRLPGPENELILWTAPGHRSISNYMNTQIALDPRIRMTPISVRDNYAEVYGNSHVLVHPSLSDGYAYAVVEAMASGLPVIVTSTTGSAELIEDGVNGYIVPPRDTGAILDRLQHLRNNPGAAQVMGAAARKSIEAQSPRQFGESYRERLRSLSRGSLCTI